MGGAVNNKTIGFLLEPTGGIANALGVPELDPASMLTKGMSPEQRDLWDPAGSVREGGYAAKASEQRQSEATARLERQRAAAITAQTQQNNKYSAL